MFVTNGVSIDTRVIKEAASLASAGNAVTVFGLRDAGQAERETLEGFAIQRLRPDTLRSRRSGALRALLAPLALAWALADYWRRAFRAATAEPFDVYHAHDLVTLPVAWAARARRGGAVVYDAHELFTELSRLDPVSRAFFRVLETLLIGRADRVITVNDSIAAELSRRYGVAAPRVLRNCPRTLGRRPASAESPLRERARVPAGRAIVLYQGLYMPHRGLENLVRASAAFEKAHLVFMGWGPLLDNLKAIVVSEGLADRVTFIDPVPMGDLLAVTAGADVGVIPYRNVGLNNFFTSPNKLFEYCAAGVPVAASRFPELVKVVEGLQVGRTFDPDDPASIAAAVNAIVGDPVELARLRENAGRAAPSFSWEREAEVLQAVYDSLPVEA
ncbi:MAG TPA: glycosyltransferase family 4 protein [Vicinamibacteria bacterium]|nr:glycosyltransferase family 4 protein [Vicinamibacteria bacterium]